MKIYSYNNKTGEFLGTRDANIDPLETQKQDKLVYLKPADTTEEKPPRCKKNEVAVFGGERWTKKKDFRGAVYYSKDGFGTRVAEIGKVLPPKAIVTAPPTNMRKPRWENDAWVEKFVETPKKSHLTDEDIEELKKANTVVKLRSFIEKYLQV